MLSCLSRLGRLRSLRIGSHTVSTIPAPLISSSSRTPAVAEAPLQVRPAGSNEEEAMLITLCGPPVGQLPYSSYASVSTPYSYFGLGRTNNYVENLFVGSTRHQAQHFVNIEGLIPNSQVVISPYQPPGQSTPATWTRELYLHPGDWIPFVIATLGVATLILGLVVIVLHVNEKVSSSFLPCWGEFDS